MKAGPPLHPLPVVSACVGPVGDLVVRTGAARAAAVDARLGAVLHVVGARSGRSRAAGARAGRAPVPPAPPPPLAPPPESAAGAAAASSSRAAGARIRRAPPPPIPPVPPRPVRAAGAARATRSADAATGSAGATARSVVPPVPPVLVPPVPPTPPLDPPVPPCPVVPPVPLPPVPGVVVPAFPEQPATAAANRTVVTSPMKRTGCVIGDLPKRGGSGSTLGILRCPRQDQPMVRILIDLPPDSPDAANFRAALARFEGRVALTFAAGEGAADGADFARALAGADIAVTAALSDDELARAPRLRWLSSVAAGLDEIITPALLGARRRDHERERRARAEHRRTRDGDDADVHARDAETVPGAARAPVGARTSSRARTGPVS